MSMTVVVGLLVGVVLGALVAEFEGAIAGAVLGYLLATVSDLRRRLAAVERELRAPRPRAAEAPPAVPLRPAAAAPTTPPAPAVRREPPAAPPRPAGTAGSSATLARLRRLLFGGNLPVRLGVVLLFFGAAFLLKFAAEHALLPVELRLTAVALGALALLGFGWRLRRRHAGYGLVLQGGGAGVLYLTVFAAMRLYQLLPPTAGFALLVVLVALSSLLAVLQNSVALAALGAAGGFLAPVLASTGGGSHVGLFSYYALLNAGILGIAYVRAWRPLNLVGFAFTFVIGTAWGIDAYRPELLASTEPFLVLFYLMYVGIGVLFALRQPPRLRGYVDGTLVFATPIAAFGLQAALVRDIPYALAWSAIAAAALYVLLARWLWRRASELRPLAEAFLALGIGFASVAVPLALSGHWTTATWALEGGALLWVGVRQRRLLARLAGLLLQFAAGLTLLWHLATGTTGAPLADGDLLAGLCLALAGLFSAWNLQRGADDLRDWERDFYLLPYLWGLLWWSGTLIREIGRAVPDGWQLTALLLAATASALAAYGTAVGARWPLLRLTALALLPLLVLAALVAVADRAHPLADAGWLGWPAALIALYWLLYRLEREAPARLLPGLHAASLWLLVLLGSAESAYWLGRAAAQPWALVGWALVPALALSLLAGPLRRWPFGSHAAAYARLGAAPLAAAAGLWSVYANLTSRGDAHPLPYLPLLNPLDLAQAFALLAAIRWWRRQAPPMMNGRLFVALTAAVGFLWLNAVLVRSVHQWGGVAFDAEAMFESTVFQTGISLLWSALALVSMSVAARLRRREIWFTGGALIAAVVVKLFLVDLDGSETLARIVSFLGVGILLLVIGYLAPLPPARTETKA